MKYILERKEFDTRLDIDSDEFQEIVETLKEILYQLTDDDYKVRIRSSKPAYSPLNTFIIIEGKEKTSTMEFNGIKYDRTKTLNFKWRSVRNVVLSIIKYLDKHYDAMAIHTESKNFHHANPDSLEKLDKDIVNYENKWNEDINSIHIYLKSYSSSNSEETINHL